MAFLQVRFNKPEKNFTKHYGQGVKCVSKHRLVGRDLMSLMPLAEYIKISVPYDWTKFIPWRFN